MLLLYLPSSVLSHPLGNHQYPFTPLLYSIFICPSTCTLWYASSVPPAYPYLTISDILPFSALPSFPYLASTVMPPFSVLSLFFFLMSTDVLPLFSVHPSFPSYILWYVNVFSLILTSFFYFTPSDVPPFSSPSLIPLPYTLWCVSFLQLLPYSFPLHSLICLLSPVPPSFPYLTLSDMPPLSTSSLIPFPYILLYASILCPSFIPLSNIHWHASSLQFFPHSLTL